MSKERSPVRASDIGQWAYCHRAWWLARVKGAAHRRPEVLQAGNRSHHRHGQAVVGAARYERWGWVVVGLGLLSLLAYGVSLLL